VQDSNVTSPQNQHHELSAKSPTIAIVVDQIRTPSPDHFGCLSGYQSDFLRNKLLKAGLVLEKIPLYLSSDIGPLTADIILSIGEASLQALTEKRSVDKWHLSPIPTPRGLVIPTYDFARLNKQYECNLYFEMAVRRCADFAKNPWTPAVERFHYNPSLEETFAILKKLETEEEISVDVETGYGQINTVGLAWSESDAIAINVLPDRCSSQSYYELWYRIAAVLGSANRKIFQNYLYDTSFFSLYGIDTAGEIFDTMHAMKVLWPELNSNLGNVGRIYTRRPYWKDDGKVESEEGKKKDWGNVRDWTRHYAYNMRDTTGCLEASRNQREDLKARGIDGFYKNAIQRLMLPVREMCANGIPLDLAIKEKLTIETEEKIETLTEEFQKKIGLEINPNSSKQVLNWLKTKKITLPKVYDKENEIYKESVDSKSIKKIIFKHPELEGLKELQQIKSLEKAYGTYLNIPIREDGRLSYSLNITGTETLRFSSSNDIWDCGFGPLTIPREGGAVSVKSMFVAPEGYTFIEADLKAAETWYVAYASVCKKLIDMLHAGEDIHKHVAHAILRALGKSGTEYSKLWRNLGKKTGHGANYLMREGTFVENVFKDMDMILSKKEGKTILDAYFKEFPEIRQWHGQINQQLYRTRKLIAPTGWERYFYGRPGEDMLREAVAWAPQHTVPYIINQMMFYLCDERTKGNLEFDLLVQVHDALYLLVKDEWLERVCKSIQDLKSWHPKLDLPAGTLQIPIEIETAKCLAEKSIYTE
jgi:DNA polymerase I-like protein with 3'-5' exonuclease and polymerase domains